MQLAAIMLYLLSTFWPTFEWIKASLTKSTHIIIDRKRIPCLANVFPRENHQLFCRESCFIKEIYSDEAFNTNNANQLQ